MLGAPPAFVLSQDQTLYDMVLKRFRDLTKRKFIRSSRITNVLLVRMSLFRMTPKEIYKGLYLFSIV